MAETDELIARQYEDRPHLRPVLDAVLALVPSLGSVTVQARGTLVSLVSPRRTFASLKPTKSRVDLGLRLDGLSPEGRLREERDIARRPSGFRWPSPPTSTTRFSAGCIAPTRRTRRRPRPVGRRDGPCP